MSIPIPTSTGRLLRFDRLDTSGARVPVYTVGWRIVDEPNDKWTKRFLAFKQDHSKGFMGGAFLLREAVAEIIKLEKLDPATTGISIALSSGDKEVNTNSVLYRTAVWIAGQLGLQDRINVFTKQAHRSLHSLASSGDRDREVAGKYVAKPMYNVSTVIMLDDFVTRGATFGEMQRALAASGSKVRVIGLALGKNEKAGYASRFGYGVHNQHIAAEWNDLWKESAKRGEQ